MKTVFFGAPDFAAESLLALIEGGHEILAVVSQPDKGRGRSGKPVPTPVGQIALEKGILLLRPEKIRDKDLEGQLRELSAEIFIVAAYGQFLPLRLLNMPEHGAVNVHASLLPKYRGASPVATAIIKGESITGISIMQMAKGMDTGPVLHMREIEIAGDDTAGSLTAKLAKLGGEALLEALDMIKEGRAVPVPQDDNLATYAPLFTKEMGLMDFSKSANEAANLVRGLDPWPGAYVNIPGGTLKIWRAASSADSHNTAPGTILSADSRGIRVACKDGVLELLEVQAPGGKRLAAVEYIKGRQVPIGQVL